MTTILHVEDDPDLAEVVQLAFVAFGFAGTYETASTVADAREVLAGVRVDLVISDMSLPDGSGLDVVRLVRRSALLEHIPILILSGDDDRSCVERAYALGASCYVAKSGGRFTDVVRALHDHWLRDALLPRRPEVSRTHRVIATEIALRTRAAEVAMRIAGQLGGHEPESEFWLTLALRQGNLANLFAFLGGQLGRRELPEELLAAYEAQATQQDRVLAQIEDRLEGAPVHSPGEAYHLVAELIRISSARTVIWVSRYLFPIAPSATGAMTELLAHGLEELSTWLAIHAGDDMRERIDALRADAAELRAFREDARLVGA